MRCPTPHFEAWKLDSGANKRGVTRELSKKCLAKPEKPLILGRSGAQDVAMVTKLFNSNRGAPLVKSHCKESQIDTN